MQIDTALYPQLQALCWNRAGPMTLSGPEALALYERNWRFVDQKAMDAAERALLDDLIQRYGNDVLLAG